MKWKIALSYNRLSKVQNVLLFVVISTSSNCFLSNYYKGGNGLTVWRKRDGETSKIKAWKYFQLFYNFTALRKHTKKRHLAYQKGKCIEMRSHIGIFKTSSRSNLKTNMYGLTFISLGEKKPCY